MIKKPIVTRYQRVEKFLSSDSWFKARLSKSDVPIQKTSGEQILFSAEVVATALHLEANGSDAGSADRVSVLRAAKEVLTTDYKKMVQNALAVKAEPAKESKPVVPKAKPVAKPPPPAAAVAPPAKPKPVPIAKAQPVVAPPPAPVAAPQPEAPKVPPATAAVKPPAKPVASASKEDPAKIVAAKFKEKPGHHIFDAYVGAILLIMSAEQLLELHDTGPGKEKRLRALADVIQECQELSHIPDYSDAKKG